MSFPLPAEFWSNFWANALSDIFFGVIFGTVFGLLATRTITMLAERRNAPDLVLSVREPDTGNISTHLAQWPPQGADPEEAELQFKLGNTGRVAATNWLVILEFPYSDTNSDAPAFRLAPIVPLLGTSTSGPVADYHYETRNSGRQTLRFQYASEADLIHSGYQDFQPQSMRVKVSIYEAFLWHGTSRWANTTRKYGTYRIYADHMKTKEGKVSVAVDSRPPDAPKVSFAFYEGDFIRSL